MKKFALIILIINSFLCLAQRKMFNRFPDLENKMGTHFPIEIFKKNDSKNYSSSYLKGKPTLVNFWSTTCEPCLEELPYLKEIETTLGSKVNFVAITYDSKEKVNKFLSKKSFNFLHITDALPQLKLLLPIIRNPMSFIIDRNGNIKEIYGSINGDNLELIEESLKE